MRIFLALATGPRHPTADGRAIGDLAANDLLDGVRIVSAALVPYLHSHTYDILPATDTGTYYAGGVLIGSTMAPEKYSRETTKSRYNEAPARANRPPSPWRFT